VTRDPRNNPLPGDRLRVAGDEYLVAAREGDFVTSVGPPIHPDRADLSVRVVSLSLWSKVMQYAEVVA
jgi:hypothetical protein